jgi:hypothetical protein
MEKSGSRQFDWYENSSKQSLVLRAVADNFTGMREVVRAVADHFTCMRAAADNL